MICDKSVDLPRGWRGIKGTGGKEAKKSKKGHSLREVKGKRTDEWGDFKQITDFE